MRPKRSATWRPGWYELDQPIEVGRSARFAFFASDPEDPANDVPVFYNTLWRPAEAVAAHGVIESITHPELGALQRVDTEGLDYTFVLADGTQLVVDAEEEPGRPCAPAAARATAAAAAVRDWTLSVEFSELGALEPAPKRLER